MSFQRLLFNGQRALDLLTWFVPPQTQALVADL